MNYLGHAVLSFGNAEVLVGNMIGDHVKGRLPLDGYPVGIRKGIELHRHIDEMVDKHPAIARAKLIFREDYRLYSGAIIDTVMDHFLANDPAFFSTEAHLENFTMDVYRKMDNYRELLPPGFATYYPHMKQHNWLLGYRKLKGIEKSLQGLARRAKYMPPPDRAYASFVVAYHQLNGCYYDFIGDIVKFAKAAVDTP